MSQATPSAAAQRLAELRLQLDPQLPYNLDSMFPKLTGWGAKGDLKTKHKLIQQVEPLLRRLLRPGEEVLYVAKGVQTKFSEQYFLGYWATLINQTVFVLTNLRLIMLHSDTKGRPRHTYWLIYYNQIKKFKAGWTGQVALDLVDGTQLRFSGFRGTDRKQMPALFESALATYQQLGFNPQSTQSRENLCSHCLDVVPKAHYACGQCGQQFWKPSELALRSLIFPSWGDFLMGHTLVAVMEMLGYGFSWLILLVLIAAALADPGEALIVAVVFVFFLIVEHAVDAGLTYFIAKKGLTPKGRPG